jgi:hypothetical protein
MKIYSAVHFGIILFSSYFTTLCITRNKPQDILYSWVFFEGKKSRTLLARKMFLHEEEYICDVPWKLPSH